MHRAWSSDDDGHVPDGTFEYYVSQWCTKRSRVLSVDSAGLPVDSEYSTTIHATIRNIML